MVTISDIKGIGRKLQLVLVDQNGRRLSRAWIVVTSDLEFVVIARTAFQLTRCDYFAEPQLVSFDEQSSTVTYRV